MRLSSVREAACIRANFLLNQANSKKGYKAIQPEISKVSEIFGIEFDKHIYKSLFDEIDFKDTKALMVNKNSSNKVQYFIHEFPVLLDRPDFINIFSQILMGTSNISSPNDIFDGLNKLLKLTYENQFKIIISYFFSMNEKFQEAAKNLLQIKCQEIHKEGKCDQLSQNTVQNILHLINTIDTFKNDSFFSNSFTPSLSRERNDEINAWDLLEDNDEIVELDMILRDLGPLIINNSINMSKSDLIDIKIDEKRLASFILFLLKHQNCFEDKENRYLNKVFLKSLDYDIAMTIDENTEKKINVNWNIEAFYKMFKSQIEFMDINIIFNHFDDSAFSIKDKKTFEYFINVLQKLKIYNQQHFINLILKKWNNEHNQIEFLNFLINNNQPDLFSFKNTPRKVKKTFELSLTINKNSVNHLIEAWSSIDLIELLLKLARGNYYLKVKELFEWPIVNVPELIVLAISMLKNENEDFLSDEIINETLPLFLGNHVNSIVVLDEVWSSNKELVIKTICSLYRSNPDLMNLSRILDITQKLKESLIPIVSCNDHYFTVNLAILAVKRDFLHIDQWLAERISKVGDDFIECLLNYIKDNVIAQCRDVTSQTQKENILEKCQLSLESLAIIFENLTPNKIGKNPKVSKRIEQEITDTYKSIFEIFDELQIQPPNSEEIEEAANKLYKSLFQNQITIEEVVEKMKNYKNSQIQKESEIYACMIHSLLDEYRFFHEYPERELIIMATLFGQSINQKLLDGIIETIALKYVIEGLKKGSGNMYTFAIVALEQFLDKLNTWPQYLQSLINIPSLKSNSGLYDKVIEKYNELNNKNKIKESDAKLNMNNPIVANYINFDNNQIDEKRNEKNNLSKVSKMPEINKNEFMFVMANNNPNTNASNLPPNFHFNPGMPPKNLSKNIDFQNMGFFPQSHENFYFQQQMEEYDIDKQDEVYKFSNKPVSEDYKILKQELEGGINLDYMKPQNFNSGDKSGFPQSKIKLPKPNTNMTNLNQILGNENESTVQAPPQDIIDKINFIFNSMSKNNINEKSTELKIILSNENIIKWFSNFFIVNRVSAENNNHQIYNELITMIDSKELNLLLYKDTVSFIKRLLLSENLAKDNKEKNVLKNLGSWLGIMTLAKNKPILAKDLDIKEIIFEAFENGKLMAIVTFVCRILDHSSKTKVFHPKNPWIQAILSVLSELYHKPYLKNSLKFEIEKIFKTLELDLTNFTQSRLLDNLIVCKDSPDFTKPQSQVETSSQEIYTGDIYKMIVSGILDHYINDLLSYINRTSNLVSKNDIATILTNSLVSAINEILSPVVERAVNISLVTTRELILKDFAFEKDDVKFKNAANLCIKSLAGSLAMVTCKEPLRIGFNNQLKDNIIKKGVEIEYIVEALNNNSNNTDILEIGCNYIQNYVIKRAIDKIEKDKVITEELEKRRKSRALDLKPELVNKIKNLPDILRPTTNGLTNEQYRIYEEFDKVYDGPKKENIGNKIALLKMIVPALKEFLDIFSINQNISKIINKYEICMFNIQFITRSNETVEFSDEDDNIIILSKMISDSRVSESIAAELVAVSFKYIINASKQGNLSLVNINSEILKGWVKLYPSITKEITYKLLTIEDLQVRFKYDIHNYFIKKNIFDFEEYEKILFGYLDESTTSTTVRRLINTLISKNVVQLNSFKRIPPYMIDPEHPDITKNYYELFSKKNNYLNNITTYNLVDWRACNIKDSSCYTSFKEMCKYSFKQILNIIYHNYDQETIKNTLKSFTESSMVKSEEQNTAFIMIITELAIKSCLFFDPDNYIYPESEARCIMILLSSLNSNRLKFFENVLFGIFKTFHYDYIRNTSTFNQRPYYKLLINLMYYLYIADNNDEIFSGCKKIQYFQTIADVLRIMKPHNYPGFSIAWMDLISSKYFASSFLDTDNKLNKEQIPKYEKYLLLIIDLISYLQNFTNEMIKDFNYKFFIDTVYKLIFILSTSYPEFLSYYYFIIIASLPPSDYFLQLKNIILHCSPPEIEQPDPFYDEFKVDSLSDIRKNSLVLFDISSFLGEFKELIDEFLENKNDKLIDEIIKKLNCKDRDISQNYIVINAIVIYWSQHVIKMNNDKKKMSNSEVLELFIKLIRNLDSENRDHLINSIINELRYPSNQTYYYSCLLLCVFFEIKNEQIEEHILKNILERLLFKPYPWGVIVTFVELSRHPKYDLFKKNYISQSQNKSDKTIENLVKFIRSYKVNKNLDNFIA